MNAWRYGCWLACMLMACMLVACVAGCSGCRPEEQEKLSREELEKRKREQRDAIELADVSTLPPDAQLAILVVKPGHWQETRQQIKSTREDLQVVAVGSVSRGNDLVSLPGTNIINDFARRSSLPKGQSKTVELQYFTPYSGETENSEFGVKSSALSFRTELFGLPLMTPILPAPSVKAARELKPHEYQLVAMGPQALSYEYLAALDTVYWSADAAVMGDERTRSYFPVLTQPADQKYPLPKSMLTMTAVAAIIWDDVSAEDLSVDQKNALVDWIHWGGQLLISGPNSWSRLQQSFLSPYLPATSAESIELEPDAFRAISNTWDALDVSDSSRSDPLQFEGTVNGLKFNLGEHGNWLPGSGELVAERRVGRGRVVVTGFSLRDPKIYRWKYFSNFFSTGLLRRQARQVNKVRSDQSVDALWQQQWVQPFSAASDDPRFHSNVRILSRDLPAADNVLEEIGDGGFPVTQAREPRSQTDPDSDMQRETISVNGVINAPIIGSNRMREDVRWGKGGAAWSDDSGLAQQSIRALNLAAGIELPSRNTILALIAGYLTCLVPLNWLVFRIFRRLEFAWLAAPILAIIGVGVVTRVARLDIGFARRTTEISVLELHGDHPRGHLTQYVALYTSLSTNYSVDFPENGSVALPMGVAGRSGSRAFAERIETMRTSYGLAEGVRLEPVAVESNSTEKLHAEQMIDLPGGILLNQADAGATAIRNTTGINLNAVMVLKRMADGGIRKAWIGDFPVDGTVELAYDPLDPARLLSEWESELATQPTEPEQTEEQVDSLWIGNVLNEVVRKTPLMPGQTRLFGYTDDRPGSLQVSPAEDQFDGRCVVVAHLTSEDLPEVKPDISIMSRSKLGAAEPSELSDPSDVDLLDPSN